LHRADCLRLSAAVILDNPAMRWANTVSRSLCSAAFALWLAGSTALAAAEPLWFDGARPGPQARQAIELLDAAASHGLAPQDYDAEALHQAVARASLEAPDSAAAERLELALTAAMQRYLTDLHRGRIDPRQIHHDFTPPRRDDFDAAATLRAALAAQRLPDAAREAAPSVPLYERLREALARYRGMAEHPAWRQPLPPLPGGPRGAGGKLEPGRPYAGLAQLAQRLDALGDLAANAPPAAATQRYEGALVAAVSAFQQRHALAADGVIGQATLAQLQVSPAARVRQIELMLERLRWTPLMQGPRMVVINIPEFVLRAYEVVDGRIVVREQMKVIVGKALDTRTPLFDEDMRFIEFSPYWNVPPSIARNELVPRLQRDPGHFAREGFEFVAAGGEADATLSAGKLDAVLAGQLRIRQRPGPQNALGDIKFVFPNRDNIYLHHTPSLRLFERERRDFSHGCIRVEQPVALARFVLQGMPEWTEERIRQAMAQGRSATLRLAEPVPVLIAYGTTLVIDGRIHFFEDLYGLDRRLAAALQQRSQDQRPPP
jgi:L,D-transpeptidase YcbB